MADGLANVVGALLEHGLPLALEVVARHLLVAVGEVARDEAARRALAHHHKDTEEHIEDRLHVIVVHPATRAVAVAVDSHRRLLPLLHLLRLVGARKQRLLHLLPPPECVLVRIEHADGVVAGKVNQAVDVVDQLDPLLGVVRVVRECLHHPHAARGQRDQRLVVAHAVGRVGALPVQLLDLLRLEFEEGALNAALDARLQKVLANRAREA